MRDIFITFLNISLSVSILFLLLTLVDLVVKTRYSRRWKHLAFLLLGIRLILPINLGIITLPILPVENVTHSQSQSPLISDINLEEPSTTSSNITSMYDGSKETDSSYRLDSPNNSLLDSKTDISLLSKPQLKNIVSLNMNGLLNIFIMIWLLGVIIFSLCHLNSYISFNKKIKSSAKPTNNTTYLNILKEQTDILHITRDIPLLIYDEISSPLLIGYSKPCIILPNNKYSKEQITFIIKHELTHYTHHDLYIKLLLVASNALHWFNPLLYILVKHASLTMELYCDESVTAKQPISYREQYSLTLLQIIKDGNHQMPALLSTGFSNNTKHMKERFRQIMNTCTKRKGALLIILTISIILMGSNLTTGQRKKSAHADTLTDVQTEETTDISKNTQMDTTKEKDNITNILVLGLDSNSNNEPDNFRPDSILLITLNNKKSTVTINTILRDILVDIPGHENTKIANAYVLGGEDLMIKTLNHNFGITIDHSIVMDMNGLETSIDKLGGTTITLSKVEAEYLNKTNFISKKSNRNVIEGSQLLNGNQILGYLRIRHVPTNTGEINDYGRTKRLTQVLKSLMKEISQKDISQLLELASTILPSIKTNMSLEDITSCLNTLLSSSNKDYTCIPRFEDCTSSNENGMSVLTTDFDVAKKMFSDYMQ